MLRKYPRNIKAVSFFLISQLVPRTTQDMNIWLVKLFFNYLQVVPPIHGTIVITLDHNGADIGFACLFKMRHPALELTHPTCRKHFGLQWILMLQEIQNLAVV